MTALAIIKLAREAGILEPIDLLESNQWRQDTIRELERFAALVADAEAKRIHDEGMVTVGHMREQIAAEREACAKVCIELPAQLEEFGALNRAVAAIRARGNT